MLLRKEVTHATDLDLLTAIIGNRRAATKIFAKAHFSLFTLMHPMPHENGDLFCAEGQSAYASDPMMKVQAARERRGFVPMLLRLKGLRGTCDNLSTPQGEMYPDVTASVS